MVDDLVPCLVPCLMPCLVACLVECLVEQLVEQFVEKLVKAFRFFYKYLAISFVILILSLGFCKKFNDFIYIVNILCIFIFNFSILFLTFRTFTFSTFIFSILFSVLLIMHFYFQ